jgi:cytochrome c556
LQALSLVEGLAARCAKGDEEEDKAEREAVMKSIMTLCQQVGTLGLGFRV